MTRIPINWKPGLRVRSLGPRPVVLESNHDLNLILLEILIERWQPSGLFQGLHGIAIQCAGGTLQNPDSRNATIPQDRKPDLTKQPSLGDMGWSEIPLDLAFSNQKICLAEIPNKCFYFNLLVGFFRDRDIRNLRDLGAGGGSRTRGWFHLFLDRLGPFDWLWNRRWAWCGSWDGGWFNNRLLA